MAQIKEEDIVKTVDTRYNELQSLRERWDTDYDLWRLKEFKLSTTGDYDNFTTNEPKTLVTKIVEILAYAEKQIKFPLDKKNKEERGDVSNAERLAYGGLNLADSRLNDIVQPTIQEQLALHAVLRGWTITRVYIHNTDEGTVLDIAVWDPYNVAWQLGDNKMLWVCNRRYITKDQAQMEYGKEITGKKTLLYDWWDSERNIIFINKEKVKENKHDVKHPPVRVAFAGATPLLASSDSDEAIKYTGESVYAANRGHFPQKSKLFTYYFTNLGYSAKGMLVEKVKGGKKSRIQKSPWHKGAILTYDTDEGVAPMITPTMPKDSVEALRMLDREMITGGISPVLYGLPEFGESGYQTQLLTHAAASTIKSRQKLIEGDLKWIVREMLSQYSQGGFDKLHLIGRNGSNEFFDTELTPEDVRGDWFPEVKLIPVLPEDSTAKVTRAQMLRQNRLLSRQTIMDRELGVQDTDAEKDRINREDAEEMPFIKYLNMAEALAQDGDIDAANALMQEYYRTFGAQTPPTGKAPMSPRERSGEAKESQYATGASRSVMPSEEMGKRQGRM